MRLIAMKVLRIHLAVFGLVVLSPAGGALAECSSNQRSRAPLPDDLTELSPADLLNFDIDVTSASKKVQKYREVASAIYVLTQSDIRRSGAMSVPEALRLVPGLNVAQINSSRWAISSRGFNQRHANKLLVLIDGQSIFTPGFNGVFWEQHELNMREIDRIEVIRGPGAALWGDNAVNGIINIITCSAHATHGSYAAVGGGNEDHLHTTVKNGGALGEVSSYRISVGQRLRDDSRSAEPGRSSQDDYSATFGELRIDSEPSHDDSVTLLGRSFFHDGGTPVTTPSLDPPFVDSETFSGRREQYGGNWLARWNHNFSPESELQLQLDYTFERQDGPLFPLKRHTGHFDAQHRFTPFRGHDLIYGFEFRLYHDRIDGNFADDFVPANRSTDLYTWFLHDEITLVPDTLKLILGSKFEKNVHTGFELMPNARMVWTSSQGHTVWTSVSRAVAPPSRVVEDVIFPLVAFPDEASGTTGVVTLFGNRSTEAEDLIAYEAGYRSELTDNLSVDLAIFYNDYDDILSGEPGMPFVGSLRDVPTPTLILPLTFGNELTANGYGGELAVSYTPLSWWNIKTSYSYLRIDVDQGSSLDENKVALVEGGSPMHQALLHSMFDLTREVELDAILRFVDQLSSPQIDSYLELDLRLGWHLSEDLEIGVIGKNLLDDSHQEFQGQILPPPLTEIERSVFAQAVVYF